MKKAFVVLPLLAAMLLGAGCSSSDETAVVTDGTRPGVTVPAGTVPTPVAPTVANGCANPYFPLQAGYKITYRNQGTGASASSYTMNVTSANATRATVSLDFDSGIRSEQTYDCTNGNVQATGYVDLAAGMSGMTATAQTRSVSGQLIPANARVGSTWNSEFKIAANVGGTRAINATVTTARAAQAEEQVTVPAGTFTALRVRSSTTFAFEGSEMAGVPAMGAIVGEEWWVKGKGLVKTTSELEGQTVSSEATAIVTP